MKSAFGDTLESVSHVGHGATKRMPDANKPSYAVLALLRLGAEPGPAAWVEDPSETCSRLLRVQRGRCSVQIAPGC